MKDSGDALLSFYRIYLTNEEAWAVFGQSSRRVLSILQILIKPRNKLHFDFVFFNNLNSADEFTNAKTLSLTILESK